MGRGHGGAVSAAAGPPVGHAARLGHQHPGFGAAAERRRHPQHLQHQGLAQLDRCSRPVWVLPKATHHSVDVMPDGSILSPIRIEQFTAPRPDLPRVGLGPEGWTIDDGVALISPAGEVVRQGRCCGPSTRAGATASAGRLAAATRITDGDPLHLNDVEMLRPEMAGAFPMFEAGDLLVSFRDKNTVAVLDHESWRHQMVAHRALAAAA